MIADGGGHAVAFALAPGLLGRPPSAPLRVVADRGDASRAFRDRVWSYGARPAIAAKRNEAPVACPDRIHVNRNRVERLWGRLKDWRAIATRYEQTAQSFTGVLRLAAAPDRLRR